MPLQATARINFRPREITIAPWVKVLGYVVGNHERSYSEEQLQDQTGHF